LGVQKLKTHARNSCFVSLLQVLLLRLDFRLGFFLLLLRPGSMIQTMKLSERCSSKKDRITVQLKLNQSSFSFLILSSQDTPDKTSASWWCRNDCDDVSSVSLRHLTSFYFWSQRNIKDDLDFWKDITTDFWKYTKNDSIKIHTQSSSSSYEQFHNRSSCCTFNFLSLVSTSIRT